MIALRLLLLTPLVLAGVARPDSTWMLESVIAREEGINPADGLLGVIQKGLFQEALRAAIGKSDDAGQVAKWTAYHRQSVEANLEDLLNATASSRDLSLDRLVIGRSIIEGGLDEPLHRNILKSLRRSIDLQDRNENGGLWYFVDPPAPYEAYGNLSYSDGMYAFAPFAALYGARYGDPTINLDEALRQVELLYEHSLDDATGLVRHGYDGSREAPWADQTTGASPVLWGRSLAWYLIGVVDTLEIVEGFPKTTAATVQRLLVLFQKLAKATVAALENSARVTGRYAVWQVFDEPGAQGNYVEASASVMIAYVLAKGVRLGYLASDVAREVSAQVVLQSDTNQVVEVARKLYDDVRQHFVSQRGDLLEFKGTCVIASLHEAHLNYEYYTHRAVTTNSLIGTSAFVLASLEMEY